MCLNYLSKTLPDHPFLSYGPSNTPSPRQGVQNDSFFLNYYGTRHRTEILRLSSKSWRPPLQNYESFKKNLTQTKVFISVSAEDEYLHSTGLCTCLHGAIPALIAALPALIAALPAQIATLPAQIATLPEGERERARERERDRERERASEKVKERESEGERESTEVNPGFNPKPSNLKPKP